MPTSRDGRVDDSEMVDGYSIAEDRKRFSQVATEQWNQANEALEIPPWLSASLSLREKVKNDDSSGFGGSSDGGSDK